MVASYHKIQRPSLVLYLASVRRRCGKHMRSSGKAGVSIFDPSLLWEVSTLSDEVTQTHSDIVSGFSPSTIQFKLSSNSPVRQHTVRSSHLDISREAGQGPCPISMMISGLGKNFGVWEGSVGFLEVLPPQEPSRQLSGSALYDISESTVYVSLRGLNGDSRTSQPRDSHCEQAFLVAQQH